MNKSILIGVIAVVVVVVGGYLIYGKNNVVAPVATTTQVPVVENVATVNGSAITKAFFDTQVASAIASLKTQGIEATTTEVLSKLKTQVMNDIISNELVTQGIAKAGIKPTAEEIEKQFQTILTQTGGAEKLQAELVKSNLTEAQLRANISKQLALQTYLLQNIDSKSITVSKEEIAQFYADYSKAQKAAGQKTVPALKDLTEQIKQQITANKQQALINAFVTSLREKADVKVTI